MLLLGGGAGAYVMLGKSKPPPAPAPVEVAKPPPIYVNAEPLSIPVMRGERIKNYFYVTVALQVASDAKRDEVRDQMPRLRDAYLRDLTSRPAMRQDVANAIDFDAVKQRLLAISEKMLGPGVVEDVLIVRTFQAPG